MNWSGETKETNQEARRNKKRAVNRDFSTDTEDYVSASPGLITTPDIASSFFKWYLRSVFIKRTEMRRFFSLARVAVLKPHRRCISELCPDDPGHRKRYQYLIPGYLRLSCARLLVFIIGYAVGQLKNEHT
jgi:hypothetical protein